MANAALPLDSLAQRITQQQSELEALRQELEARQNRLADLARRKAELENQLQDIEAEIQAVDRGTTTLSPVMPSETPSAKPASPGEPASEQNLGDLLVELVRAIEGPATVKQLTLHLKERNIAPNSRNLPKLVESRVRGLVAKGIFQRLKGKVGVVLAKPRSAPKALAARPEPKRTEKTKPRMAPTTVEDGSGKKTLRVLMTDILAKSREPLPAREVARQVLAAGYESKSPKVNNVIWAMLSQMDNVEKVPDKGYRLKRR